MLAAEIIKSLASLGSEALLKLVMIKLTALMPILNFTPFRKLTEWYLAKRIDQLIKLGQYELIEFFIDLKVNLEKQDLIKAIEENQKALATGSMSDIQASQEKLKNSFREFIRIKSK